MLSPQRNRRTSPPHPGLAQWTGPNSSLPTLPRLLQLAGHLCRLCFESRGPPALADAELALGRQRRLGLAAQLCLRALRGPASGEAGAQLRKLCVLAGHTRGACSGAGRAPSKDAGPSGGSPWCCVCGGVERLELYVVAWSAARAASAASFAALSDAALAARSLASWSWASRAR